MKKILVLLVIIFSLAACKEESNASIWKIGGKHGMSNIIFDQEQAEAIKICSDFYKDIGFSTNVNVDYDGKTFFGLIEGLCITLHAKKVRIRFATPSSGKRAAGTFEVLPNYDLSTIPY